MIYGEAYFNVSPSSNHQGSAFKVHSKNQLVEVLGTEFNIKAYNNETQVFTTLVEGSVKVKANKATAILHPNEQAITNNYANKIQIKKVVASNLVSWYKGVFNFKSMPLKEIMKALSRWYDLEYEFKNSTIEKERFTGVIKKDQSIEEIAEMLKSAGFIKNYQIKNKKITLE